MPEFPNMPRRERRKLIRWLGANYPCHLRMMAGFLDVEPPYGSATCSVEAIRKLKSKILRWLVVKDIIAVQISHHA
jgi:hypothetical protein